MDASGSIRKPPPGAGVACQSSSKPSSGAGRISRLAVPRTPRSGIRARPSRPEQVLENAAAADVRLPDDVAAAVDAALERVAAR